MPKTTLVLVTALFGVICANRLMDNRLLRSSISGSSSYMAPPYKSISDINVNSFSGRSMKEDLQLKTLEKISKPCVNNLDYDNDLTARNCNDNIVKLLKSPNNYLTYDSNDDDSIQNTNAIDSYQSVELEAVIAKKNAENMKLLQPKLKVFPVANYKDFYDDLIMETAKEEMSKRNGNSLASVVGAPPSRGCDCKIRNDLVDLGQQHFPRYLLNAICHSEHSHNELGPKCWSGSVCRPLEYKVKVLTFRTLMDNMQKDPTLVWLPDDLRQIWKFKTVTVTAGCFCS